MLLSVTKMITETPASKITTRSERGVVWDSGNAFLDASSNVSATTTTTTNNNASSITSTAVDSTGAAANSAPGVALRGSSSSSIAALDDAAAAVAAAEAQMKSLEVAKERLAMADPLVVSYQFEETDWRFVPGRTKRSHREAARKPSKKPSIR